MLGRFAALLSKRPVAGCALLAVGATVTATATNVAHADDEELHTIPLPWPHKKHWWSTYDPASLRRGFEVYRQVCSACHSMEFLPYRELIGITHTTEQAKAIAATIQVDDGPDDKGEMFKRPGRLYDFMPRPYPNEDYARYINNGALPPDLSYIIRSRHGGEDYVFSILTSYKEAPAGMELRPGQHYNPHFAGGMIGMAPPLNDGGVEWEDDTPPTPTQQAKDVATFLAWVANPEYGMRGELMGKLVGALVVAVPFIWYHKKLRWATIKTRRITFVDHPSINDKHWKTGGYSSH
jgi:ubiquinol-cytochrome c reductase cytochrome c1 subunit